MKKRLLFISTIFPSEFANRHATYNLQLLSNLKDGYDVDVINPIPWFLKIRNKISYKELLEGMSIFHPTYWYTPGMLRSRYGFFYYLSIKSCAARLIKESSYDVVLSSWLYPDGWAASKISDAYGIPTYTMSIGTDANRLIKGSVVAGHTVQAISRAKKTLCVSKALKDKLVSIGADPRKMTVLYNGVNRGIFYKMDKTAVRTELGFEKKDAMILFVGNLLRTKGLDELADAFAAIHKDDHFKNTKLIVAGSGMYESEFKKRLKAAGMLDRAIFMGSCPLPVVAKLMNAADVLCLPSYSEGLPNVVLEALCCNTKVVATHVGGIPEFQTAHKNLYLVPPKDAWKLAETLMIALNAKCHEDRADDIYSWKEKAHELAALMTE